MTKLDAGNLFLGRNRHTQTAANSQHGCAAAAGYGCCCAAASTAACMRACVAAFLIDTIYQLIYMSAQTQARVELESQTLV